MQHLQNLVYILGRVAEFVYLALLQRRRRSTVVTPDSSSTNDDELTALTANDSVTRFFIPTPPVSHACTSPTMWQRISWLSATLTQLWFLHPTWTQNRSFWRRSQANLLAWYRKTKPNTTKAHIHQSKEMYNTKQTQKLKPALAASYNISPRNGDGLFWSLTYSPGTHMGLSATYHTYYVTVWHLYYQHWHQPWVTITSTTGQYYLNHGSVLHQSWVSITFSSDDNCVTYLRGCVTSQVCKANWN